MLTREEVLKIAKLARLELTEKEVELYRNRLGRVLDYMRELNALPTPADAFVRHVPRDAVAFREDRPVPFASVRLLLENAPAIEGNSFALPAILENE
jgi:aspartyl-tRNA(Asn)/glutamyl-tRNA(Gln) amidotransferase subunit C